MHRWVVVATLLVIPVGLAAQPSAESPRPTTAPSYRVTAAPAPIRVDGRLDDPAWRAAEAISLDWEWTPGDNTTPPIATVCRISFDRHTLYLGCRADDPRPDGIRAHLFDRDATDRLVLDDHLNFMIDPFNDQRRAFQFRVNPFGVQADAVMSTAEGYEDFSWDAIWQSAGRITEHGYEVEVAIPFRSLRFPRTKSVQTWGFLFERSWPRGVRHRIQSSPHDRANQCLLCEANKVTGFEHIVPGGTVEASPTATALRTDVRDGLPSGPFRAGDVDPDVGADFRWGVTPNLSFNATLNPDFSHVEADVAQLDVNTRFALFYPEKRPFFLEGADFFSTPIQAVCTRTVANPDFGLKLTGKVGGSSRSAVAVFGARDATTNLLFPSNQGSAATTLDQASWSGVSRFRRDIGTASYVGVLYTGRGGDGYGNHVAGFDLFHRLSPSAQIRVQYLGSATEYPDSIATRFGQPRGRFTGGGLHVDFRHQARNWYINTRYEDNSPGFRADGGFLPRVDVRTLYLEGAGMFFRRSGLFTLLAPGAFYVRTLDHAGQLTDETLGVGFRYDGPWQSAGQVIASRTRERFAGRLFDRDQLLVHATVKPLAWLSASFDLTTGGAVDFANARGASALTLQPGLQVSVGRGLSLGADHAYQRLSHRGRQIFTANLLQTRAVFQADTRTMIRAIAQYRAVDRNPAENPSGTLPTDRGLFSQLLFSYKVNPQTVLFLGYSGNSLGTDQFDLTRTDRTFFAKIGYAWRP